MSPTWRKVAIVAVAFLVVGFVIARLWPEPDPVGLVDVPDVVAMWSTDATVRLVELGLNVETQPVEDPDAAPGTVVGQEPAGGTSVAFGSVVVLRVAVAPGTTDAPQVTVPNLRGLTYEAAAEQLEALGLLVSTETVVAEGYSAGTVVDHEPGPEEMVEPGTTIRLQVAGDAPEPANPIAWMIGLGLDAPTTPPQFQAYDLLLGNQCPELAQRLADPDDVLVGLDARLGGLYAGAAAGCLAALHDQPERWPQAEVALASVQPPLSCVDADALELLRRLVRAHQDHPDGPFRLQTGGSTEAPACPTISSIEPGQPGPGSDVRIFGTNLGAVIEVGTIYDDGGGRLLPPVLEGDALVFSVGEFSQASEGCVYLVAGDQWNAAGLRFTLEPAPGATGSPPPPIFEIDNCPPKSAP